MKQRKWAKIQFFSTKTHDFSGQNPVFMLNLYYLRKKKRRDFMKIGKKIIAAGLVVFTVGSSVVGCTPSKPTDDGAKYTYNTSIGTSTVHTINPHEWEYSTELDIMELTQRGLFDVVYSKDGNAYDVIYELAEKAEDVTAEYAGNDKYGVPADATKGFAYKITLRDNITWEDGTAINADTFLYSMEKLLDPAMQTYRASTYYQGQYALANANEFYNQDENGTLKFEDIGIIKNDDLSFTLVFELQMPNEYMFYWGFSSYSWLVKEDLYEGNMTDASGLAKTTYGTSASTYASYGPYKLVEWQEDKVIKLTKNDAWYGWNLEEFKGQYQTTDVVYQIIDETMYYLMQQILLHTEQVITLFTFQQATHISFLSTQEEMH